MKILSSYQIFVISTHANITKKTNISTYFVMSDKSLYPRSLYIKVWLYYSSFYFHAQPSMFDSLYSQSALPEDTIATCKHLQLRTTA